MKHTLLILTALLLAPLAVLHADAVKPEPNAKLTLEFPELPATYFEQKTGKETVPMLSAQLPDNYAADKIRPQSPL